MFKYRALRKVWGNDKKRVIIYREIWKRKGILRRIYFDWYELIIAWLKKGETLVVGSGTGNFKEYYPNCISTDIISNPWIDIAADATKMPLRAGIIKNIVCIDLIHHLKRPEVFFKEVVRILQKDGRLLVIEPHISPVSFIIRKLFHHESMNNMCNCDYNQSSKKGKPLDANMMLPTILFFTKVNELKKNFPELNIRYKILLNSFIIYPLSGGFNYLNLIPECSYNILKMCENLLSPLLKTLFAFKMFVVIEKR